MKKPPAKIRIKKDRGRRSKKYVPRAPSRQERVHVLEEGSLADMRAAKHYFEELSKFHHQFYSELSFQRSQRREQILEALNSASVSDYEFSGWQRVVKYRYSLHPLSTVGSIKDIGGRFNVGQEINPENYPVFHALYIAENKDTALQETLGQVESTVVLPSGMTKGELVLTKEDSISILNIHGKLDRIIDLTHIERLKPFVDIIKTFTVSESLYEMATALNVPPPTMIKTVKQLSDAIFQENWRETPRELDIPAAAQVFGQIVKAAKIEGILYRSKFTNQKCLAIFPENFSGTASYCELIDPLAHENTPKRVDATSWRKCLLDTKELFSSLH